MKPCLNVRLKEQLSVACSAINVEWSAFARQTGTRDFLIETADIESPLELAVRALSCLPLEASSDCEKVISSAVVMFLDKHFGASPMGRGFEQRVKDTHSAVKAQASEAVLRDLLNSWYR